LAADALPALKSPQWQRQTGETLLSVEEEKRFVLLASVLDLGGSGTKKDILDGIQNRGYLKFNEKQVSIMHSRNEPYWRNDIAFVRKHLVSHRYLSGAMFNDWQITEEGRSYFARLCRQIVTSRAYRMLAQPAVQRALSHGDV